jgi:hypothetical protein
MIQVHEARLQRALGLQALAHCSCKRLYELCLWVHYEYDVEDGALQMHRQMKRLALEGTHFTAASSMHPSSV